MFCRGCTTTQLDYTVSKEVMFGDHTYLSGTTRTLDQHFMNVAREVDSRFFEGRGGKSILDIGSNDGTQLKHFAALGWQVQGVESSRTTAQIANDAGVPTVNAFFDHRLADSLGRQFHVINAAGVFFHLEDLHSVTEGIRAALAAGWRLRRAVPLHETDRRERRVRPDLSRAPAVLHAGEHRSAPEPAWSGDVRRVALARFTAVRSIGFVGHRGARPVTSRLQAMRGAEEESQSNDLSHLSPVRVGYRADEETKRGASRRGTADRTPHVRASGRLRRATRYSITSTWGPSSIECLVERNPLRKGLYSPGMHIPIVLEEELGSDPDLYYVLAWNFKQEILSRYRPLVERGVEFFFPVDPGGAST